MRPKTGLPKRRAIRSNPVFACGLRDHNDVATFAHPNMRGKNIPGGFDVMSMFSGCGGLDLGFLGGFSYLGEQYTALPYNIVQAIDFDERCIDTYNLNIAPHGVVGDLTLLEASSMPKGRVLIGGFPCQDFSSSGPKTGFAGKRGQLYLALVNYMREHKPDVVVGENVPHLASLHGGAYLKAILEDLSAEGYNFTVWNLSAPDYGIAQSRRRLFLVGVRKELGAPPQPPTPTHVQHRYIEDAIGDLAAVTDESVTNQSQYFVATKATSGGGQGDHTNRRGEVAYCIRANAKARIQFHYELERRLTVRECARLQSFPDQFVFPFAAMSNMTQIGNAVPPVLGYRVAQRIAEFIQGIDRGEYAQHNAHDLSRAVEAASVRPRKSKKSTQADLFHELA